jgi:predicted HD phosphohydrolase|tara:strand:- start:597 stop:1205 length:609 start_codon:yes stop_codon:yes gene_type:complete
VTALNEQLKEHTMTDTAKATETPERTSFKSFEESTAEDWAVIAPQLSVTQGLVADRVIGLLRELGEDYGGFPVNRLEHSLQTATRAERDGKDDEYVFCALIHDIGDTLSPFNHPAIAAGIVKPFVSEANHFMVKHHGEFQGYYFWHHLGMDKDAREKFRDSEFFGYTEEFCAKYDQTAFDADYVSNPLEHYEPLIRQILRSA